MKFLEAFGLLTVVGAVVGLAKKRGKGKGKRPVYLTDKCKAPQDVKREAIYWRRHFAPAWNQKDYQFEVRFQPGDANVDVLSPSGNPVSEPLIRSLGHGTWDIKVNLRVASDPSTMGMPAVAFGSWSYVYRGCLTYQASAMLKDDESSPEMMLYIGPNPTVVLKFKQKHGAIPIIPTDAEASADFIAVPLPP